jgi:hypothetical protein
LAKLSSPRNFIVSKSIFAGRKKECDARSFYHHTRLEDRIFETDWTRIAKKTRFIRTLGSAEDVAHLKEVLRKNFMNIMHVSNPTGLSKTVATIGHGFGVVGQNTFASHGFCIVTQRHIKVLRSHGVFVGEMR